MQILTNLAGATLLGLSMILTACGGNEGDTQQPPISSPSNPPANKIPAVSGTPASSVLQDNTYSFTPSAIDPDGDHLTFSIINKPSWASFSTTTGTLAGTPSNANVGLTGNITVSVSDGHTPTSLPTFNITVVNVNDAPVLGGTPRTFIPKNSAYTFSPTIIDPDGDVLTFSITNKPVWANFDTSTGSLTGTPRGEYLDTTTENILISASDGHLSTSLPAFRITVTTAPQILYSDIVSGPNSGGENNQGAYLSIFGLNFGDTSGIGSTTKVFINDAEVATYKYMGLARSQFLGTNQPIQQITVQIGTLGNPNPGVALPIRVQVNGVPSNSDHTFVVQPGDILYVDNANGDDTTALKNDISRPWRHVQTASNSLTGAFGAVHPGDIVIMRGGTTWTDIGYENRFARFKGIAGTAPNGLQGNGPVTIMGYPGEDVHILAQSGSKGGFHGMTDGYPSARWITLSNLRIEGGDRTVVDSPINLQAHSDNWRIVNNELFDWFAEDGTQGTQAKSAAIAGNGTDINILGNHIHHIDGGTLNHGIYLDTGATNVEIAYNHIHHMNGGNIIQTFDNLGIADLSSIEIHHNRMHDGNRYGMNISAGTDTLMFWNNIVYNTSFAGLRFAVKSPSNIDVYHNTFYNVCITPPTQNYGAINNDDDTSGGNIQATNNIVFANQTATGYFVSTSSTSGLTLDHNLYYGLATAQPSIDLNAIGADPLISDPLTADFRLTALSPAIDFASALSTPVTNDIGLIDRPQGAYPDIGAYEFVQSP